MNYLKVEFFVPLENVNAIIKAINDAQLIKEGNYDYCYAYTLVKGHFRPLEGANPFLGNIGGIEQVDEVKVEFRMNASEKKRAESIIKDHHPYETPVINFIPLV